MLLKPENVTAGRNLRGKRGALAALKGLDELLAKPGRPKPPDELRLFKALRACEYFMRRCLRQGDTPGVTHWEQLQQRIADHLVRSNMGLVFEMRRRSRAAIHAPEEDVISEGMWALFQSVRNFDPWRGFRFSTYACNSIARAFMQVSMGSARRHERWTEYAGKQAVVSAVAEAGSSQTEWLVDRLNRVLENNAASLTSAERFILERRFLRPPGKSAETLESIGRVFKVSKERVRQIQVGALRKLREVLQDDPAMDHLN